MICYHRRINNKIAIVVMPQQRTVLLIEGIKRVIVGKHIHHMISNVCGSQGTTIQSDMPGERAIYLALCIQVSMLYANGNSVERNTADFAPPDVAKRRNAQNPNNKNHKKTEE